MLVEILVAMATVASLVGAVITARGHPLCANIIWCIDDAVFVIYAIIIDDFQLFVLFGMYQIIAFYGIVYILSEQRKERLRSG